MNHRTHFRLSKIPVDTVSPGNNQPSTGRKSKLVDFAAFINFNILY